MWARILNCNYIGGAGEVVYGYTPNLHEGLQPRRTFLRTLYRQNVIATPTVLTRRSAYDAVGPDFSESLRFDDWEMWLRIAVRFDVGFLDVYDADYRIHTAKPRMKPSVGWANIGSSSSTRWTVGFRQ